MFTSQMGARKMGNFSLLILQNTAVEQIMGCSAILLPASTAPTRRVVMTEPKLIT